MIRSDTAPPRSVGVFGLGNVLLGDDGFGPSVIALLSAGWQFPAAVELVDAGTPGLHLIASVHGHDALVLVDAVAGPGEPGAIRCYRRDELARLPILPRVSPHDPAVLEALAVADLAGRAPRSVLVVGVVPASLEMGAPLSEPVRAACALAAEVVVEELTRLGVPPRRRPAPAAPEEWWLRHAMETA